MNRLSVVTLQFGSREYFDASREALKRYAFFHGYAFVVSPGQAYADGRDLRWSKVDAVLTALVVSDLVLYLDADSLPVSPTRPVSVLESMMGRADMLLGEDSPGHANTGVMLFRRGAVDVLEHWRRVPDEHPETRQTWPVDELGFNKYTLPRFRARVALPRREPGLDTDFLRGSFVRHFCNGTASEKATRVSQLVDSWREPDGAR
jgi:hypothetical protein